jgi:L-amino acid N-acyltransferase YncA
MKTSRNLSRICSIPAAADGWPLDWSVDFLYVCPPSFSSPEYVISAHLKNKRMTIRNALESDLPAMLEIYNDVILNTTAVYDYEPHTYEMRKAWFQSKQKDGYPVFLATDKGKVAGFSSIGPFRAWAAYQFTVENSIYVAADCRGHGVGRMLLAPLIDAAKKMSKHTIVAGIDSTNTPSVRLHESFGFQEVAFFKEVGFKFNKWLDLRFLQLILK